MKSYNRITLCMVILVVLALVSFPIAFGQGGGPGGRGGRGGMGGGDRNPNPMMGGDSRRGGDNRGGGPGRGGPRMGQDEDLTDAQIDRIIQAYSLRHSPQEVQNLKEQRKTQTRDRFIMNLRMVAWSETNTETMTYGEYSRMLDWYEKHVSDEATGIKELRDTNYDIYKKRLDSLEDKYRDIRNRATRNRWADDLISVSISNRRLEIKQNDLLRQYWFTVRDPNQRNELLPAIKDVVGKIYDTNLDQRQIQLNQMKEQIADLQKMLDSQLKDMEIQGRVDILTRTFFGGPPGSGFDGGRGRGVFGGGMQGFPPIPDSNNTRPNIQRP